METFSLHRRTRAGSSNKTEVQFLDFVISGRSLYDELCRRGYDYVSCLGWLADEFDREARERLTLKAQSDLPDCCLIGVLPYILYGGPFTLVNAWFESVSGFTTTGSSILADVEALPYGLLFWRAATHWIGGIGIIVFVLAVIPGIGQSSMLLSRNELSSLALKNFQHRTQRTLKIVLTVYLYPLIFNQKVLILKGLSGPCTLPLQKEVPSLLLQLHLILCNGYYLS